jgi:prophage regulatory protein
MRLIHSTEAAIRRERFLRLPDVEHAAGIKKSTVYQLVREGKFPAPIRLTRRCSVWTESAVLNWVNERIQTGSAA